MRAAQAGNSQETFAIWGTLLPVAHYMFYDAPGEEPKHWLEVLKAALSLLGRDVSRPAPPLGELRGRQIEELRRLLLNVTAAIPTG